MFGLDRRFSGPRRRQVARDGRTMYSPPSAWHILRERGGMGSLGIAAVFCVVLIGLFMLRQEVVPFRPGQYVPHDITARVDFTFFDQDEDTRLIDLARKEAPHVYHPVAADVWDAIQSDLLSLPDKVHGLTPQELDPPLRDILDSGSITQLDQDRTGPDRRRYEDNVHSFIAYAELHIPGDGRPLVVLPQDDWARDAAF